ncbi:MAG: DUF1553 domain-containing protein [Verrucomicrobia bacterium]|nr:DUF1553 domain-containing protein [Verrucomicrobiota bacterium]
MRSAVLPLVLAIGASFAPGLRGASVPDFNRDIRPILSNHCFQCHGPDDDKRKGGQKGLRLDTAEGALADLGGGAFAVVPGKPDQSELVKRLITADADEVMPPPKTGKKLAAAEIELLKRWIAGGASYARHWSYEQPRRPELPSVRHPAWVRQPVDRFILAQLERAGLQPQPEADRHTLARRVALDLTGLPPTPAEVRAFVADPAPEAYERFVDAQLAKPAFGEHWARAWLDLARYADSKGYADDQPRSIWAYRDYVIEALNRNLPFDQFTIEQLAGDLLPNPTQAQLFATGFHRNTMNNTEGGTDDEEFRTVAVVDRVNTTMAVWMGTSMACAQCHNHKYDPISQKEYFQVYAIFNQTEDADRNDEAPVLEFFTEAQQRQRAAWEAEIAAIDRRFREAAPGAAAAAGRWAREFPIQLPWRALTPTVSTAAGSTPVQTGEDGGLAIGAGPAKETYTLEVSVPAGDALTALRLRSAAGGGALDVTRVRAGVRPPEPHRRARYVRIEMPGAGRVLSLAEVEVFSGGRNLAATGTAKQSSTAEGAEARRAIDGNTDGDILIGSVSQTAAGDSPWWELDLGSPQPLERVVIWGRRGDDATPSGLRVTILDERRQAQFSQVTKEFPRPTNTIDLAQPREVKLVRAAADPAQGGLTADALVTDAGAGKAARGKKGVKSKAWKAAGAGAREQTLVLQPEHPLALAAGEKLVLTVEQQGRAAGCTTTRLWIDATTEPRASEWVRTPAAVLEALRRPEAERDVRQRELLLEHYVRQVAPEGADARQRLAVVRQSLETMPLQSSPILRELPDGKRRTTHVQLRGNFLERGEEVQPGVPATFPPLPSGGPADRLAFARWLVSPENPLTARVVANRWWEGIFGVGLVRTTEEFGAQGELPSHPELLDWLATEVVAGGWDMKRILRLLVTSATYRQNSRVTPESLAADSDNRLLSRGPRHRLVAEMVRDQSLAVSGLLSSRMHGPSTRPFQPAFDLRAAFGGALDWKTSEGEDRYRRGLYTEWRRSSPYPSMVTFDAPNREVCTLRRNRTNTPLQALVTLNDPVYVEAAQALGRQLAAVKGPPDEQVREGLWRVLLRPPRPEEVAPLVRLQAEAREALAPAPEQAAALAGPAAPAGSAPADLAAWTAVANVLLNLDEFLMKP